MADAIDVQVIIPTAVFGSRVDGLLADLARELHDDGGTQVSVFVVDADAVYDVTPSVRGTGEPARQAWPSTLNGPAVNRNRGASRTDAQWLVFLDDDVRVPSGWWPRLWAVITDPDAADLIGGDIGSQQPRNWFSQAAEDFVVRHREYPEGWYLAAAHLVVRSSAFRALDGFDTRFGYGGEDWDLSKRAHALGLRVSVDPSISVFHANATTWRQLRLKAEQYGRANALLDVGSAPPGSTQPAGEAVTDDVRSVQGGVLTADQGDARVSVARGLRWARGEYRLLRRLGRSRLRAARSAILQAAWMRTYLSSYANSRASAAAGTLEEPR